MATAEQQADFLRRFKEAIAERKKARNAVTEVTRALPRLKATQSKAATKVAELRADAKDLGIKLPKLADVDDVEQEDDGPSSNGAGAADPNEPWGRAP